jgi:hypothetical protein
MVNWRVLVRHGARMAMEPMRLTKDLMIVRAGPRSLHPTWLDPGKARNWDLFICPYEEVPPPPAGAAGLASVDFRCDQYCTDSTQSAA